MEIGRTMKKAPSMSRLTLLLTLLLTCAAAVAQSSPASAPAATDPTAAKARQLLDQMIAALGGEAWLTYKTVAQQGRSYIFYHGKPTSEAIPYRRFYQYPDKERQELPQPREMVHLDLGVGVPVPLPGGKPGDVVLIYNGDKGYEKTYKGTAADEDKTVQEVVRRRRHSLEVVLREWLQDPRTVLFYDGQTVADQQLVDVVTLLNKDNDQLSIGIDIHTHLPINKRYSWRDPDKYKVEDETIYGNYRKVQGIQTPYTVTNKRDGEMTGQSFLSHAEYNTTFAPGFFDATVTHNPETYNPRNKK
jgi:hypothetical protein